MAGLTRLARMASATPELTRAIDLVKKAVDPVLANPITSGVILQLNWADFNLDGAGIQASYALIPHRLGRTPVGVLVVDTDYEVLPFSPSVAAGSYPSTFTPNYPALTGPIDSTQTKLLGILGLGVHFTVLVF